MQSGEIDLSTPSGRMVARMLGSAARYESEHKAERQRRKALELARAGKVGGGGTRPFGFEDDFKTIRSDEAMILRSVVARFLAGESIGSLTVWLDQNNIRTSSGITWSRTSLRRLIRSARISGQRAHNDEILGPAEWKAIITPEQTARVRAILDDPRRRFERDRCPTQGAAEANPDPAHPHEPTPTRPRGSATAPRQLSIPRCLRPSDVGPLGPPLLQMGIPITPQQTTIDTESD